MPPSISEAFNAHFETALRKRLGDDDGEMVASVIDGMPTSREKAAAAEEWTKAAVASNHRAFAAWTC